MIHTTIGIYPNGSYKVNGVTDENLKDHVEYNKVNRFGRALIVNGEIVYKGMMKESDILEVIKSNNLKEIVKTKDTAPYV